MLLAFVKLTKNNSNIAKLIHTRCKCLQRLLCQSSSQGHSGIKICKKKKKKKKKINSVISVPKFNVTLLKSVSQIWSKQIL